ncbi:MED6-domain-containing protein [Glonium stellatum]|uniref:Mediator of RNA polymerase II transcription subunit 6 n=1 Tax=Glonium stellatum TaxID=574774 RepID=A0A8E2EZ09_9PEZI|nr:MED6-domain-containing protein [Glonium stellatum]
MAQSRPPLDETVWYDPVWVEFLRGIHTNSVHRYFYASTFFDHMSNNNVILQQANRFMEQRHLLDNRQDFEDAVRKMTSGGLQFMVVGEPENNDGPWVIQKQQRTVQQGLEDEIEVLGTYWIVAEKIFMAPSVADILGSKILSATTALTSFLGVASTLSLFTPATGHTYFPIPTKASSSTASAQTGALSRATTPGGVPAPTETASQTLQHHGSQPTNSSTSIHDAKFSDNLFMHSLSLTTRFATEYADENPLQGEPGSFVFSSTNERIAAQNAAQAAAQLKAQSAALSAAPGGMGIGGLGMGIIRPLGVGIGGSMSTERESAVSTAAPTPKPPGDVLVGAGVRKGSQAKVGEVGKLKRRKSRVLASPTI